MPPVEIQPRRVTGFILFSADDYRATAQACRVAAIQAEKDASTQISPGLARMFNASAKHYRDLAQKFELAARVL